MADDILPANLTDTEYVESEAERCAAVCADWPDVPPGVAWRLWLEFNPSSDLWGTAYWRGVFIAAFRTCYRAGRAAEDGIEP